MLETLLISLNEVCILLLPILGVIVLGYLILILRKVAMALTKAEGVLPVEYETGTKWCMNKKTFAKVQGMVDLQGQPIARVNYGINGTLERAILGRDVVVSPYVADDLMFMFDFSDYILNTIYDMGISKKQDWDTEDLLTKAVMSVDGKVIDNGSIVKYTITAQA